MVRQEPSQQYTARLGCLPEQQKPCHAASGPLLQMLCQSTAGPRIWQAERAARHGQATQRVCSSRIAGGPARAPGVSEWVTRQHGLEAQQTSG